mmetsp:Transcript_34717/g.99700  ORF Transcript_34717/g.99700 Transcript_34717/m.99700 type:complete len:277 (-) Transcript_34717:29-859(-)
MINNEATSTSYAAFTSVHSDHLVHRGHLTSPKVNSKALHTTVSSTRLCDVDRHSQDLQTSVELVPLHGLVEMEEQTAVCSVRVQAHTEGSDIAQEWCFHGDLHSLVDGSKVLHVEVLDGGLGRRAVLWLQGEDSQVAVHLKEVRVESSSVWIHQIHSDASHGLLCEVLDQSLQSRLLPLLLLLGHGGAAGGVGARGVHGAAEGGACFATTWCGSIPILGALRVPILEEVRNARLRRDSCLRAALASSKQLAGNARIIACGVHTAAEETVHHPLEAC